MPEILSKRNGDFTFTQDSEFNFIRPYCRFGANQDAEEVGIGLSHVLNGVLKTRSE